MRKHVYTRRAVLASAITIAAATLAGCPHHRRDRDGGPGGQAGGGQGGPGTQGAGRTGVSSGQGRSSPR